MKPAPIFRTAALVLATCLVLAACQRAPEGQPTAGAPQANATPPDASGLVRTPWALPVPDGAAQPDLSVGPDGRLLLSWIRPMGNRNAFQYAAYLGDDSWESAPKTIAVGSTLSANWANTPHIVMTDDRALWAHWLQVPADAGSPHASDVMLTRSQDNGVHWAPPVAVNEDNTGTEHGFVSMWPADTDAIGMAWLDGRRTAATPHMPGVPEGRADHADMAAAMTVRAARFDGGLQRSGEAEVDATTCDCCGTDAALTGAGPLLVYRDRTRDEIRDIAVTHLRAGKWDTPRPVHEDGWKMAGCPLNGPSVATSGPNVAVAWYTAAGDEPALRLATSKDNGTTFAAPVDLDQGSALQGRVDIAMDGEATWLVWLREDAKGQTLELARLPAGGGAKQQTTLATLAGRGRGTGFPKIAVRNGIAFVAWTDLVEGRPRLSGMKVWPKE